MQEIPYKLHKKEQKAAEGHGEGATDWKVESRAEEQ